MNHHIITSSTKVYIRFKENHPTTQLMSTAFEGFSEFGSEIVPFYFSDEINNINDLGPETIICGYIGDIHLGLKKMGKPIPEPLDYPESLMSFLNRKIYKSTLGDIRNGIDKLFIKPIEHKLFNGFIFDGTLSSRKRVISLNDETPIWVSECVNMFSEYRCIILEGEILDVRRYKGDWALAPDRDVVENAVICFENSGKAPVCYTLDFAVTSSGTVLIEANDGFAFGHYGMNPAAYATCLAARWKQLANG